MVTTAELREIANWREGLIAPSVFFDQDIYRQEQERVFGRAWLVVGHEDMVRKPGDYITNYMGEVPVIVSRDAQNQIQVLVNRCAHRGNQVCLFDRGNATSFTCSYHGWSYGSDGGLIGVPMEKEIYRNELDKPNWGLERAAKVTNFKGMIFATFDPNAPSLEEWLGEDGMWWLQTFVLVDHIGGLEALPGWHRYATPGNWKHLSENFIGDDYHVFSATHVAWFKVVHEFGARGLLNERFTYPTPGGAAYEGTTGYGSGCPIGVGLVAMDDSMYETDLKDAERFGPKAVEWVHERHHRFAEVLREREEKPYSFMNGCIFPNMSLMGFSSSLVGRHFILFHPRGAAQMEQWQWTMVEKEAPEVVKEVAAQRVYQGQHMAGTIAPDDVENLERMVEALRSPQTWRRPHNYRMQLGHEKEGPQGLPINLGPNPSEVNQRNFYRFWLELMERP
jgi:phenylpropionate dioxygenase-like ring-hydroxylating dioxygenase large terminal subunit